MSYDPFLLLSNILINIIDKCLSEIILWDILSPSGPDLESLIFIETKYHPIQRNASNKEY